VCKLLGVVMPDKLYLGQKDSQQVAVVRQMAADLNLPVRGRDLSDRSGSRWVGG
jgi:pantoate--beta-alanine ligase